MDLLHLYIRVYNVKMTIDYSIVRSGMLLFIVIPGSI